MAATFTHCAVCDERIGVYEPVVVSDGTCQRVTSLAREPLLRESGVKLSHEMCADRGAAEARPGDHGPPDHYRAVTQTGTP